MRIVLCYVKFKKHWGILTWSWSKDFAASCLERDSRVWSSFMQSSLTADRSCIILSYKSNSHKNERMRMVVKLLWKQIPRSTYLYKNRRRGGYSSPVHQPFLLSVRLWKGINFKNSGLGVRQIILTVLKVCGINFISVHINTHSLRSLCNQFVA